METSKPGKSIYLRVGVFLRDNGEISITATDVEGFHTTVSNRPGSKRYHPNLYMKLAKALQAGGAPHPKIEANDPDNS